MDRKEGKREGVTERQRDRETVTERQRDRERASERFKKSQKNLIKYFYKTLLNYQ